MNRYKLQQILNEHKKWLEGSGGKRAILRYTDLQSVDLQGVDLQGANLWSADLWGADLWGADLRGADLQNADLWNANLRNADLQNADLRSANLQNADLRNANLRNADLQNADLRNADLRSANLRGAVLQSADLRNIKVDLSTEYFFPACPAEGSFIAYKKARGEKIVVLEIPADARRSSATSDKCRCDKAKVLRIENLDGTIAKEKFVCSNWNEDFIYKVGKIVRVENFDTDHWNECSTGIHFFISREMAVAYELG